MDLNSAMSHVQALRKACQDALKLTDDIELSVCLKHIYPEGSGEYSVGIVWEGVTTKYDNMRLRVSRRDGPARRFKFTELPRQLRDYYLDLYAKGQFPHAIPIGCGNFETNLAYWRVKRFGSEGKMYCCAEHDTCGIGGGCPLGMPHEHKEGSCLKYDKGEPMECCYGGKPPKCKEIKHGKD